MKAWIQTLENRQLFPTALTVDAVGSVDEIAHSLAGEFRFTRQTRKRYSVAEHCVRGAQLLPAWTAPAFLLHELSEVYLPDIAAPLKPSLRVQVPCDECHSTGSPACPECQGGSLITWSDLERQHTHTILQALDLASLEPLIYCPEVRKMDLAMLMAEKRDLCGPSPEEWAIDVEPAETGPIEPWTPDAAAQSWRSLFSVYFGR